MSLRFTVLASGSAGNASLMEAEGFGLLLDIGLGPRQLASRLAAVKASWLSIHAVLLTHTHSDHWNERTLTHLLRRRIPLYCHPGHHDYLRRYSLTFSALHAAQLVRDYQDEQELRLAPALRCWPLPVRHDCGATFGFRFEGRPDLFGHTSALAYLADLGCWDARLAASVADVDLLALEFNHDLEMEYASGRTPHLIARVLGDEGHLSNAQAAALVREVLRRSPGRLRQIIQLHLSRDCNRPALAADAARAVLAAAQVELHTASQDRPSPTFALGGNGRRKQRSLSTPSRIGRSRREQATQPWLPGWQGD
jgi:phosphoribosyl 1,2-cyclic phosphodiesterase